MREKGDNVVLPSPNKITVDTSQLSVLVWNIIFLYTLFSDQGYPALDVSGCLVNYCFFVVSPNPGHDQEIVFFYHIQFFFISHN